MDVNAKDDHGNTALMITCSTLIYEFASHSELPTISVRILRELLKHKDVDVNCQDNAGRTPLHRAGAID